MPGKDLGPCRASLSRLSGHLTVTIDMRLRASHGPGRRVQLRGRRPVRLSLRAASVAPAGLRCARPLKPTHGDDLVVPDSHVGAEPRVTGAVHDPTAPDEDVEGAVSPAVGGSAAGAMNSQEEERGERGRNVLRSSMVCTRPRTGFGSGDGRVGPMRGNEDLRPPPGRLRLVKTPIVWRRRIFR